MLASGAGTCRPDYVTLDSHFEGCTNVLPSTNNNKNAKWHPRCSKELGRHKEENHKEAHDRIAAIESHKYQSPGCDNMSTLTRDPQLLTAQHGLSRQVYHFERNESTHRP